MEALGPGTSLGWHSMVPKGPGKAQHPRPGAPYMGEVQKQVCESLRTPTIPLRSGTASVRRNKIPQGTAMGGGAASQAKVSLPPAPHCEDPSGWAEVGFATLVTVWDPCGLCSATVRKEAWWLCRCSPAPGGDLPACFRAAQLLLICPCESTWQAQGLGWGTQLRELPGMWESGDTSVPKPFC